MCGIAGKFNFDEKTAVSERTLQEMVDTIKHRGPDDTGAKSFGSCGLAHARLAIIDPSSHGHEPMSDKDETVWLTFNGEIYNFRELRKELKKDGYEFRSETDAEVLVYLYKKYGKECVKYLEGMFAFAIWDTEKEELFLACDRAGQKPLKYYHDKKTFIFTSELKAILKNKEVERTIDWSAVDEYLTYQYVPHPKTGFLNISKLEPAHTLTVRKDGSTHKEKYWEISYEPKEEKSEEEWKKEVEEKLKHSIEKRLVSDVPLGAHLSGGIDSSIVVAMMAEMQSEPIKTFSIGFEEDSHNELPHAKKVAGKYETDHHEFVVKPDAVDLLPKLAYHYEEPFADSSALPTWYLSKLTKEHVTVALNGDAGDENFGGYTRYTAMQYYEKYGKYFRALPGKGTLAKFLGTVYSHKQIPIIRKGKTLLDRYANDKAHFYQNLVGYFRENEKENLYTDELKEKISSSRGISLLPSLFKDSNELSLIDQLLFVDTHSYMPGDLLVKVDIASMAHGLEVRSPFLDHGFMELVAKMPTEYKIRGKNKKYLLKQIAYDYLPSDIIDRPKQGFGVPIEKWFRGALYEYTKEELLDETFLKYGFRKEVLEKMIEEHRSRHANHAHKLWALLMLRHWLRTWFEEV